MNRRRLLGMGLGASALGVAITGGALWRVQPGRRQHPPIGKGRKPKVDRPVRVVIVGGGVAGMSAASTLASRGVQVVLCEQSDALGGKLAGWPIRVGDETLPMEHGFHAFFSQYYTLRDLFRRAGADHHLASQAGYTVLHGDHSRETFGRNLLPFPLDLVEIVGRSPGLSLADVQGDRPGMDELVGFDPVRTFAQWDGIDMQTFISEYGLDGPFARLVLRPFGQASMNQLSRFSAAEAIRFFHFYMLGNPEGLSFDALSKGVHLSVLGPLRAHLEGLGVEIRTSTTVEAVRFEDGRARGVVLRGSGGTRARVLEGEPGPEWEDRGGLFVRTVDDRVQVLSNRCTHMGCPVALSTNGFVCPCHAGRYDADGRPVAGPPPRPLESVPAQLVPGGVRVGRLVPKEAERIDADAVIVATELGGLKAIATGSRFSQHMPELAAQLETQQPADPYSVARFWFDRPVEPSHPSFYTVTGLPWTDGIATYSAMQEASQDWATRHGGSIVETHAYAIPEERQGSLESYRDGMLGELRSLMPELADAKVVHEEVMTQHNFSGFQPGAWATRPTVQTEVPNLWLAGDHVKLPFPAFLMEAAAASGRLAANALLAAEQVEEDALYTVPLRGTLL